MTLPAVSISQRTWLKLGRRTDEELVAAIVTGDHDAITILFDRYARLVFRVAERILRDPGEAEEILQTVFLDIFQAAVKFDATRGSVRIWVLQYAYHRSIRRKRQLESRHFYTAEEIESVVSEIAQRSPRMAFNLSTQEMGRLVSESLLLIDERQRKTIELTYFEGLTAIEIAERTGESVIAVRHNLYRGLSKLREHLGPHAVKSRQIVERGTRTREGEIADARA
jgi:RNA polymerase sigma-70 factor (ECF subfamily)